MLFAFGSCTGLQIVPVKDDFICEVYSPEDDIPLELLEEARRMYFETYLCPALHVGVPFEELGINQNLFGSYEEYIADMFRKDFASYGQKNKQGIHYLQLRCKEDGSIIGVCVLLEKLIPGLYYLDHIGIHCNFRRQGLADSLIKISADHLDNYIEISLDTRVFNLPAQTLYEKCGFEKLAVHPIASKQNTYFHYVLRG